MSTLVLPRFINVELETWQKRWMLKSIEWQFFMAIFLVILLVFGALGLAIPGDPSFCHGCTTQSKLGLFVIYGFGVPTTFALLLGALPNLVSQC